MVNRRFLSRNDAEDGCARTRRGDNTPRPVDDEDDREAVDEVGEDSGPAMELVCPGHGRVSGMGQT